MLKWLSKRTDVPEPEAGLDVAGLGEMDLAVVFKHSPSCPVSWAAEKQVRKFVAGHPEVPVYTILVQRDREISRQVAEITGIRHESPQILVFKRGSVVASTSHEGVTAEYLTEAVAMHPAIQD